MQLRASLAGIAAPRSCARRSVLRPLVGKAPAAKRGALIQTRWAPESQAALVSPNPLLSKLEEESTKGQVYDKPLTKSEVTALKAAIAYFSKDSAIDNPTALRSACFKLLQEAATTKKVPLTVVEGSMVLLEQLYLQDARPAGKLVGAFTPQDMLCRWQLVIGADVGSIQYIPVVEELQAAPGGTTFNLDTDLSTIFTGFSGESSWLSPGHLQYHVQRVRIELRLPKEIQFWNKGKVEEVKPDDGKGTCRPDSSKPAVTLPLPFPVNELFIYASNGDLAVLRSKLGGVILLVNKTPVTERKQLVA